MIQGRVVQGGVVHGAEDEATRGGSVEGSARSQGKGPVEGALEPREQLVEALGVYADELPTELGEAPEAIYDEWVAFLLALARGILSGALSTALAEPTPNWESLLGVARAWCLDGLERGFERLALHPASPAVARPLLAALFDVAARTREGHDGVVRELGGLHEFLLGLSFVRLPRAARRLRKSHAWLSSSEVLGWPASVRSKRLQREFGLSKHSVHAFGPLLSQATSEASVEACLKSLFDPRLGVRQSGRTVLAASRRRRTSGAHYTPWPLCVELVERVLAPLLAGLPEPRSQAILSLRVCDPAMGAGAFLIAATRYLGDALFDAWRREGRAPATPEALARAAARRAIAEHVIHGVDKNVVAVSLARQALRSLLEPEAPPASLGARLRGGDALLGGVAAAAPPAPTGAEGLDWLACFEHVFQRENPGFDAILGNPPWVAYVGRAAQPLDPAIALFYAATNPAFRQYRTLHGLFVYRAAELLRRGGRLGLVLPTSVADLAGYAATRAAHDGLCQVDAELPDWGDGAFDGVFQPCMALLSTRRGADAGGAATNPSTSASALGARPIWPLRNDELGPIERRLLDRLSRLPRLPPDAFGERGFQTTEDDLAHLSRQRHPCPPHTFALREGADIGEFRALPPQLFADPTRLANRLRKPADWQQVKLLIRQTARYPMAAFSDGEGFRNSILAGFERPGMPAALLLGLLNSACVRWLHYSQQRDARQGMPQLKVGHLRALPAPPADARRACAAIESLGQRLGDSNDGVDSEVRAELDAAVSAAFGLDAAECELVARWASEHPPPLSRRRPPAERASRPAQISAGH